MHLIEFTLACKYFYVMRKKAGSTIEMGSTFLIRCYVRLDFLQQFETDWLRQLEGLVFEKKIDYIYIYTERERERERKLEVEVRINQT